MNAIFDDRGVRFEYPPGWEIEVVEDGSRTTVSFQAPDGMAFGFLACDADCPDPDELADEALEAMRDEYPDLEAVEAAETIAGHPARGHDVEFFSLDMVNGCAIRSFQTERRTVLIFCQWSQLDGDEVEPLMRRLRKSCRETDA